MAMNRRDFIKTAGITGSAAWLAAGALKLEAFDAFPDIDPLATYPARDWEKVYREQYRYDSSFAWVCSPNCTHECRLRSFVRNGIVLRSEQNYDSGRIGDIYGNKATVNWNPRGCSNGFTMQRRVYGPHRLRYPLIRKMWKQWVDDGFPELTPDNHKKYKFDSRGTDELHRIKWEDAFKYFGKGAAHIAKKYSGDQGRQRLLDQGYPEEMLTHHGGAGTRTFKVRGGMGLTGVIGKYGMYRFGQTMALLDAKVRGVDHTEAKGTRIWSNYTWHGDQAPGHPFVHGLQASDCDMNDFRFTKLSILMGKNLIENKRADNHFFTECMERGAKIVVISPEYSPPATKADYWIPIRPQSDAALLLGVTKLMMDEGAYDAKFVKEFTDFPLLVRTDTLKRLQARDIVADWKPTVDEQSISYRVQGLTAEQHEKIGEYVVWDLKSSGPKVLTRDMVGGVFAKSGIDPALDGTFKVKTVDGKEVEVRTLFDLYKNVHLKDYDLDSVAEMTRAPKEMIRQLATDLATIKPAAIHIGEGINHWFHATETNRATYLPMMLTGNIGKAGAGSHTWSGNYKAALFQGSPETGPGFKGWVAEDPFEPNLDPNAPGKSIKAHPLTQDEEPAYWNYGEHPLNVETPKFGHRCFTGQSHMPSPTKFLWFTNVNLFNNAKWAYEMLFKTNPKIEMICSTDIEMTSSVEYSDLVFAANSWLEFQSYEITGSCSNPFIQIWKGGIPPVYDTLDDTMILAKAAKAVGDEIGEPKCADMWKFSLEGKTEIYIQRLLDSCTTTKGYTFEDIMSGKYGEPGVALFLFRTYPRVPFYEQVVDNHPFHTPTGRLQSYNDEKEVIEYGENFIVHREGPEATPYLPNVIVSSNPYIRPESYGIPEDAMGWDERQVRNIKKPWSEVKNTKNPLWEAGFSFYCLTPKSRHSTHSSWAVTDWHMIWNNQFGDPYRRDKRAPGVGEHQMHINPAAAESLGIKDGDYVYVDANPADRPYIGWKPDDPQYKVARLMLRARYNAAYPFNIVMMKHAPYIATERSVKAHETREDGRAQSEGTGYQSSFRYGSHQSLTRGWLMPMHQLDSLFHKTKARMGFIFGGEADNHAVNTTPKETLVRVTKAENGGMNGQGIWAPATTGFSPAGEGEFMKKYLAGKVTT
ncbi:MAG: molybdopterin-dependent oxidoreductase [Planctomycetes bacterium]|nr:molybdopterin-dependent oxidoreductase [Planctomycetota bacterium]